MKGKKKQEEDISGRTEKANNGRRSKQIKLRMETRDQADATIESIQRGGYSGFLETGILIRFLSHT